MAPHITDRTLVHDFLEGSARLFPDRAFLAGDGYSLTYSDVDRSAAGVAAVLAAHGVRGGDRVGLLADNGPFFVAGYYGILKAGAVAVPLNTTWEPAAVAAALTHCGASAVLAGSRRRRVAEAALEQGGLDVPLVGEGEDLSAGAGAASRSRAAPGPEDPATILYTSGSTGRPKGATLLHRNLVANTASIVEYLALTSADRVLCVLPFHYVYGLSLLNTHAAVGGGVVIENRFAYPTVALDTLEREACTGFAGVPSTFAILLDRSDLADRTLGSLRYATQAGGAMSPHVTRRLLAVLPAHTRLFVMYGATEASARLSYLPPDDLPQKLGSIGKAIPGVDLRVMREDGTETEAGEEGEIVARGDNIMAGYWGDADATAEVLDGDGYHTGDLAVRDEDGYLFITGRRRDFIKAGAHRISAKAVEERLHEFEGVHDVAVIGVPDDLLGERIVAFVSPAPGTLLDVGELRRTASLRLPAPLVPSEIVVLGALPHTAAGKIAKDALTARYVGGGPVGDTTGASAS